MVAFLNKFSLVFFLPHKITALNTDAWGFLSLCAKAESTFKVIEAIFAGYFMSSQINSELDFLIFFLHLVIPVLILHFLVLLEKKYKLLLPILLKNHSFQDMKKKFHSFCFHKCVLQLLAL